MAMSHAGAANTEVVQLRSMCLSCQNLRIQLVWSLAFSSRSFLEKISSAMMHGECTTEDWIGSDVLAHRRKIPLKRSIGSSTHRNVSAMITARSSRILSTATLNFSFWTNDQEKGSYGRNYKNKFYHRYEAMCVAINQAIDIRRFLLCFDRTCLRLRDGIDILSADCHSRITMNALEKIFTSSDGLSPLPLLNERLAILHEAGSIRLRVSPSICLRSLLILLGSISVEISWTFPSLCRIEWGLRRWSGEFSRREVSIYDGQRGEASAHCSSLIFLIDWVSFYKRADLFIGITFSLGKKRRDFIW